MSEILNLFELKMYSEILEYAKKNIFGGVLNKDDIISVIKTLLRYEYEEAAYIFYKNHQSVKGVGSPTILSKISVIEKYFKGIDHIPEIVTQNFRTTSEISIKYLSKINSKKVKINSTANLLLVIDSLGPGGAERQFVTLLNYLTKSPPHEVGNVYGLVLSRNKHNSDFYMSFLSLKAREKLIIIEESEIKSIYQVGFGNKTKRRAIAQIRQVINERKINIAMGFLEETSINVCTAALIEGVVGVTRFGSLPNIIGRDVTEDVRVKYNIRFSLLSAIDSPNIIWGANSQRCLNKYLLHSNYLNKSSSKKTVIIPNIVELAKVEGYRDVDFESFSKNKLIVISILRFSQEKRPEFFIEIAKRYSQNTSLGFVMIGDGPMADDFSLTIEGLSNIFWIKNTDKVEYYIFRSNIYLMTSIIEGSPNAVIESSQCGLPAVTADIGGVSETYTNLIDAIFVSNPYSIDSYIDAVDLLIKNESLRLEIGKRAKDRIKRRHGGQSTNAAIGMAIQHFM